ncbi:MAG: anhydro-N-acetylmuramic acid kinase [Bacteroidia bacterium]|nr:anhydro-N-acetylmuramic acid kinase [Bacteroidia bacterium]
MPSFQCLGLMSGSSCDGLDMALCSFVQDQQKWRFQLLDTETVALNPDIHNRIQKEQYSPAELDQLDNDFADWCAEQINDFKAKKELSIDLICSHGHTIYHQPEKKLTLQIGSGKVIANKTGIKTVSDFRTQDVNLGGQGAPLVPIGDLHLFPNNDAWLNLGGIANITTHYDHKLIAFDVSPCNMVLNYIAHKLSTDYDAEGAFAKAGTVDHKLLSELSSLDYFKFRTSKSLGREWVYEHYIPIVERSAADLKDKMATVVRHITNELVNVFQECNIDSSSKKILLSGGGTFNRFLVDQLRSRSKIQVVVPDPIIINFKEALIFAFLGFLRVNDQINVLSSVTGANMDHCAGKIDDANV